jgi:EF-P beta-lysylation protein EpmB
MQKGDPDDPLLRQVLPLIEENQQIQGFSRDPVGDTAAEKVPGLLQKYQGRVLLVTTGACAIHCRYCFRQHYNYSISKPSAVLDAIRADSSITEVILSGGDPLILTDSRLADLAHSLASISHVQRLRLHTRLPIILPERINDKLLTWLTGTRLQPVMVVHANHANEIDDQVSNALRRLVEADMTVLNQSVLLRGVNDDAAGLIALSEALFCCRVLPYYLHILDRVHGAAHFDVPLGRALELLEQMRVALPGYLVPKLVREVGGMAYKQALYGH